MCVCVGGGGGGMGGWSGGSGSDVGAVLNDLYFNMMMYLGCFIFVFVFLLLLFLVWLSLQHGYVVFRLLS